MAKQKYVVGALGVLVGVVVGASAAHNAQTVSFQGLDPNAAVDQQDVRDTNAGIYRNNRINNYDREAAVQKVDLRHLSRARRANRLRSAAPDHDNEFAECEGYTRVRLTRCIWSVINGEPYEKTYYDR